MSKTTERNRFESRYADEVVEVAAVTGASGVSAGRASGNLMWNASINLVAWKYIDKNEAPRIEEMRLGWLVDDKEWEESKAILKKNSIVRLQVRLAKNSMMLVKVLENNFHDDELNIILEKSLEPVFYVDGILGEFELFKSVNLFEKQIVWAGEEGQLYFDWDKDEKEMAAALSTAHELFHHQEEWSGKIKLFAAEELVELANDWLEDDNEADIDEITKEMFIRLLKLDSISVYSDGEFEMFFSDGDMFWGHSIIVSGNINGELSSAEIAG
ncbi:hypothetical protein J2Z23_003537 [Lederbergia galactosidilyticus]|uniref:DUF2262 domain-containing protein n=1 Tax=Lederbergia galactosidilytica TaxID=217031 RepID=UPI000A867463|nr:hypothetical protein [Lederbergia galactosidilytica]